MDISTEIAAIQAASEGSELRQPLVDALTALNGGTLPAVTTSDVGKILKVGANGWEVGEKSGYMPVPSASLNISTNGTYDVTNYAEAIVNVSGGSGNSVFWGGGDYYGDPLGEIANSLNITLSGEIGQTAVIVIMHRSALTVPSNFILIDNRKNPIIPGEAEQEISIYKVVLSNNSESYTIYQSKSVRICACYYVFSSDPNLAYDSVQEMDSNSSIFSYTISNKGKPTLIVISNVYSASFNNITNTMIPKELVVVPNDFKWFNTSSGGAFGFRMFAIINNAPGNIVITSSVAVSSNASTTNRVFIYTIG